jgi:hypothetical protein
VILRIKIQSSLSLIYNLAKGRFSLIRIFGNWCKNRFKGSSLGKFYLINLLLNLKFRATKVFTSEFEKFDVGLLTARSRRVVVDQDRFGKDWKWRVKLSYFFIHSFVHLNFLIKDFRVLM